MSLFYFKRPLGIKEIRLFLNLNLISIETYNYTEELASALTHGVAAVIFMVLCPILIAYAVQSKDNRKIVGAAFFSFGLLAVFMASAIYHAIPDKFTKEILNYFDFLAIYFLISGSYTAFLLNYFRDVKGNVFIIIIWITATFGMSIKVFMPNASIIYSLIIFLVMGWLGIFFVRPALRKVKSRILILVLVGGLFYTFGTYFFYNDYKPFYHAIWHLFVLGGALSHWSAVLLSVKDKIRTQ